MNKFNKDLADNINAPTFALPIKKTGIVLKKSGQKVLVKRFKKV